ncbi:P-loop containing nucleoside triphosphate hydrolase protein [Gloeophyllum trabeum ATCC 11539]|uniref:DNA 3'-5' helicase n=1 Tax=Gloeophyllum trabeum (strain ATCC 11539 / FP-39264 / Madison 617) TaxID=670483 RepID=S7RA78_GLOTA|nr:P-loop containing nucleoside triphosphate hydrolase protein [Gloeophyllum trabeum ATCC 11539]EPQ51170.1 P-loop containing nucleoside triphosphate hydrolase protein [Gloeophyllum trabeum ATCC 11539]
MEHVIKRIVFDEAHQLITSSEYRENFMGLSRLAGYAVQKIHLSATIPQYIVKRYLELAALPNSTLFFRAATYRSNVSYSYFQVNHRIRNQANLIIQVAQHIQANFWDESCRGIIFCPSIERVKLLAPYFQNCMSHAEQSSLSWMSRHMNEQGWYNGTFPWIVATTTMIHGIDHPRVKAVIFDNVLFGLVPKTQADGRTGRDGSPAFSIQFIDHTVHHIQPKGLKEDLSGIIPMNEWIMDKESCRRVKISEAMDGVAITCADIPGAHLCDKCNPEHPLFVKIRELVQLPDAVLVPTPPAAAPVPDGVFGIVPLVKAVSAPAFLGLPASAPAALPTLPSVVQHQASDDSDDLYTGLDDIALMNFAMGDPVTPVAAQPSAVQPVLSAMVDVPLLVNHPSTNTASGLHIQAMRNAQQQRSPFTPPGTAPPTPTPIRTIPKVLIPATPSPLAKPGSAPLIPLAQHILLHLSQLQPMWLPQWAESWCLLHL